MTITYSLKSKGGLITENLTAFDIQKLAGEGKIGGDDEIAKTGTDEWIPAYRLKGFDIPKPNMEDAKQAIKIKCPYCAEEINQDAKICRFCRINLSTGQSIDVVPQKTPQVFHQSRVSESVQASSGVFDGVKIGCGMFIVLPILLIFGFFLLIGILGGL